MKKRDLFYILLLAVLTLSFALAGCSLGTNDGTNDDGETRTYYTVRQFQAERL